MQPALTSRNMETLTCKIKTNFETNTSITDLMLDTAVVTAYGTWDEWRERP